MAILARASQIHMLIISEAREDLEEVPAMQCHPEGMLEVSTEKENSSSFSPATESSTAVIAQLSASSSRNNTSICQLRFPSCEPTEGSSRVPLK